MNILSIRLFFVLLAQRCKFPNMFDRAWLDNEQYEEELTSNVHGGFDGVLCTLKEELRYIWDSPSQVIDSLNVPCSVSLSSG